MMVRRPPWIVSIDAIEPLESDGGYIAQLTVDWQLNGQTEQVPYGLPEESRRDPIGWTPWLWQEIDAGNVKTVRASDQDSSQSPQ